jgi:spermidine synthase
VDQPKGLMQTPAMRLVRDRHGIRLIQHGVLISDLRTSARPTHGLYDVLASLALQGLEVHTQHIALLGFGAGGLLAPLKALGWDGCLSAVDTDRSGFELFGRECPRWRKQVRWTQADAADWLGRQRHRFGFIIEDLSVPNAGDVEKPQASWNTLPSLIRNRLAADGIAVFNLLKPSRGTWRQSLDAVGRGFPEKRLVHLHDYENRILMAGRSLPSARTLSAAIRRSLQSLGSRQANRFQVQTLP